MLLQCDLIVVIGKQKVSSIKCFRCVVHVMRSLVGSAKRHSDKRKKATHSKKQCSMLLLQSAVPFNTFFIYLFIFLILF